MLLYAGKGHLKYFYNPMYTHKKLWLFPEIHATDRLLQRLCTSRSFREYIAEHPNDEEEVEGIDLYHQCYPWEGSDMDYLYDEVSISLDGLRSIFESRRFEITKLAMCQDIKSISANG
ncbi:hypothetical protein YC2023_053002 [Brassica napus]